ncbi:MAG: hypothetical protein NVS2B8_15340 [Vulcanimicrobiaceae bacterium]
MSGVVRGFVTFAKWAGLAFVFARFHGSWIGLTVVVSMGALLFRVDRKLWRLATGSGARS